MADESRSLEDEILTLIIVHEPLLRHIISLEIDNPTDRENVYQKTAIAILEGFRKETPVEHPKAWVVFGLLLMMEWVTMLNLWRWTSQVGSSWTCQRFFNTVIPWGTLPRGEIFNETLKILPQKSGNYQ